MTAQDLLASPQLAKLMVADFLLLSEAGAFERYARTELIEGEIWAVNAVHRLHARVHAILLGRLFAALEAAGSSLVLYANPSTELSDTSLPEPDIVVAEPEDGKIVSGANVRLAIEVSDATIDMDTGRKARLYAVHGVAEYWVIDIAGRKVRQFWSPSDGRYSDKRKVAFGTSLEAATIAGLSIATDGF